MSLAISPALSALSAQPSLEEKSEGLRFIPRGTYMAPEATEKSKWSYYHKPITLLVFGGIVFLVGVLYTIFFFTEYVDVPYALGPVLLSIGLIFLVTGLVWLPIIKESIKHKGLLRTTAED